MTNILSDAKALAKFANLDPAEVDEFRRAYPGFVPDELWEALVSSQSQPEPTAGWKRLQQLVRETWSKGFPIDESVEVITLRFFAPIGETRAVWPFQHAVMFFTVNAWRARFCPRCGTRFVATSPKSTYCSDDCFKLARKDSKKAWWSANGQQWRKSKRSKKK